MSMRWSTAVRMTIMVGAVVVVVFWPEAIACLRETCG